MTDNGGLDAGEKAVEACATYMREKNLLPQYASDLRMYLAGMLSYVPNLEHTVDHVCERGVYKVYSLSRFYDVFEAAWVQKRQHPHARGGTARRGVFDGRHRRSASS